MRLPHSFQLQEGLPICGFCEQFVELWQEPADYAGQVAQRNLDMAVSMEAGARYQFRTLLERATHRLIGKGMRDGFAGAVDVIEDGVVEVAQDVVRILIVAGPVGRNAPAR
ncbi:hypothetical protein ARC20_10145 [Stenotrophomonas panacihumi]|uniref:Uncharacterized protein n=1 Tax=Stenotrophomonas panacihumi TaxID=676599 RepID=A0A0R0ALR6_9GAMM|nr:hypothetical protein ARC20_10145 [Stenotrophomonas panacihumi]